MRQSTHCGRRQTVSNRREFLAKAGAGFGMLGLTGLLGRDRLLASESDLSVAANPLAPKAPHFAAKAKAVIWLYMEGGPSAVDLFDPKPELQKHHGKQPAESIEVFFGTPGPLMRSPFSFRQYGESGAWVSNLYSNVAKHVDDIAFLKACHAESNNHAPAMFQMNTGMIRPGFPSAGAWVTYGLGSENQNLPGYVVLQNSRGSKGGPQNWGNGFLPSAHQGTTFRSHGSPILNLQRPAEITEQQQREMIDLAGILNRRHLQQHPAEPDLLARIQSYELAFRMQSEAQSLVDLNDESEATKQLYGLDREVSRPFGEKCLLARRMVERGVRFVQVYCNDEWDAHGDLAKNHTARCAETDVPISGLLADLKQRGLLASTLVVWGGEFGRMPISEQGSGRDHNPHGFLVWMAGGGVKGGVSHGETDEIGYKVRSGAVSVQDLHATILHLLGLDHTRLTYLHNGRRFRLTDVAGTVVRDVLV